MEEEQENKAPVDLSHALDNVDAVEAPLSDTPKKGILSGRAAKLALVAVLLAVILVVLVSKSSGPKADYDTRLNEGYGGKAYPDSFK